MAERKKKGVVAPKYQQTVSRDAATSPRSSRSCRRGGSIDAGALDLTLMISNVTQQDQDALLKTSEEHNLVGILATLLKTPRRPSGRPSRRARRPPTQRLRDQGGAEDAGYELRRRKLYVLTLYVNLCFIGGAEQLRNPPTGMELLFDTVLEVADESGSRATCAIYYATASSTTAACTSRSPGARTARRTYQRFTELKTCELCPQKEEHGQSPAAQTACPLRRLDVGGPLPHTGNGTTSRTSGRPSASSSTACRPGRAPAASLGGQPAAA